MAWKFIPIKYNPESFVATLADAVDAVYPDARDRLEELRLIHEFFEARDREIATALWKKVQRRCRELKICEFCGAAEVYIDGERYCTQCDAAEVERLVEAQKQRLRGAV